MKYRKRMPLVDAYQTDIKLQITTDEGIVFADPGDWIIKDEEGFKTTCDPEKFALTFEPVSDEEVAELKEKMVLFAKKLLAEQEATKKKAERARIKAAKLKKISG